MNVIEAYNAGQKGANKGLPMGDGLTALSQVIHGVQRARIYTVAAAPKVGKSTLVDVGFVLGPCVYVLMHNAYFKEEITKIAEKLATTSISTSERDYLNQEFERLNKCLIDLEIIYNSYEIDRISKEFDFIVHFIHSEYGYSTIPLPEGKTHSGKDTIQLSTEYLRGELLYDIPEGSTEEPEIIRLTDEVYQAMVEVYAKWIIPIFGEYDKEGVLVKKGIMTYLEHRDNPTGVRNFLLEFAEKNGTFTYLSYTKNGEVHQKLNGYKPNNPLKYVLVVTDHLRKLAPERGYNLKQTVDKFSEYAVELKNLCQFSFVHIIHLNRSITDPMRIKQDGDRLFPNSDDIKETGNLSEDSNYVITMFDPNDDRYRLDSHFDLQLRTADKKLIHPKLRTLHLVESRHCAFPQHFRVNMYGETKKFTRFSNQLTY